MSVLAALGRSRNSTACEVATIAPCVFCPLGKENSVTAPCVVIRPTSPVPGWVNHSAPSGAPVMLTGFEPAVGIGNVETTPAVVIRPIAFEPASVNQTLPSGPAAMPIRSLATAPGTKYSVIVGIGAKVAPVPVPGSTVADVSALPLYDSVTAVDAFATVVVERDVAPDASLFVNNTGWS